MAWLLYKLGNLAAQQRDETLALALLEQSLALATQLGDAFNIARALQGLGLLFLDQGRLAEARRCFDQQLATDERIQFKSGMAIALLNLGEMFRYQGDYDLAEQFYEKATAVYRELYGGTAPWGQDFFAKGLLALHRGHYPQAAEHFIAAFKKVRGQADKLGATDLLTGLAAVAGESNQPERAARLSGAAQAALGPNAVSYPPFDRAEFDRHLENARHQLGNERFESLQAEGRGMPLDEAIAAALAPFPDARGWPAESWAPARIASERVRNRIALGPTAISAYVYFHGNQTWCDLWWDTQWNWTRSGPSCLVTTFRRPVTFLASNAGSIHITRSGLTSSLV